MGAWHVCLHHEGNWQVLTPGNTQACARKEAQREAVDAAFRMAGDEGGGEVAVHAPDGAIEQRNVVSSPPPPTAD